MKRLLAAAIALSTLGTLPVAGCVERKIPQLWDVLLFLSAEAEYTEIKDQMSVEVEGWLSLMGFFNPDLLLKGLTYFDYFITNWKVTQPNKL